ncbi:heavy metal translocating P-type ATPase [Planctomonas sp. JC2975]|uniref:heavy metal translocating P-type ATPase n=1 Tax=Planctomonas sp. JC2975 TaxID=2729626 RepID=UPI0014764376|nr:heavy metal translocating P-type ATPase [Planctomonas sp. JC2975]NNC11026.1 heavy metal translocating P-type ATPase [Planctomonas sp. JC2975]
MDEHTDDTATGVHAQHDHAPNHSGGPAYGAHDRHGNERDGNDHPAHHEHHGGTQGETAHAGHGDHGEHDHDAHDHSAHKHSAHEHSAHDPAQFRRKFWWSLVLTVPTMVFSTGLQDILGLSSPRFPGSQFIPAVFGVAVFVYGGLVFLRGAVAELRSRKPGMMTLIALAIVVALGYSLAVTFGLHGMDFWWELATLITIMLLGHWIEMSAVMGAQNALGELATLLPDTAEAVGGDEIGGASGTRSVAIAELRVGDRVLVRPGASIPVDGVVVGGRSDVDESLLTGESAAVVKEAGASVVAGSTNGAGSLTVEMTKEQDDSALAGIMRLVAQAQASKSGAQLLADRAAGWLFYAALASAAVTLVVWLFLRGDDPNFVLERVVTVLVIACPHALGLAIPLVAQIATSLGAKNGILVRSRAALEDARLTHVVLFDKTGTLTEGRQGVVLVGTADGVDEATVLGLAAAVEADAEHPIGMAVVAAARERGLAVEAAADFEALRGRGVTGTVGSTRVTVGSSRVVAERGLQLPGVMAEPSERAQHAGNTVVFVITDGANGEEVVGLVAVADVVRPQSRDAVAALKRRGVRVAMLTGDSRAVADAVAADLGIDEVIAEVLPDQKAAAVSSLQKDGSRVMMVGDGVNDAPALAQADVGVAIGAGTDVAIESAGIVLASSDPRGVPMTVALSASTYRKMTQNLWWAAGYNIVAIPLAAGVLEPFGVVVSPALGAVLMSVSTIVVAINAQLLRRVRLG